MRLLLLWGVALASLVNASLPPMFGGRRRGGFTSHLHKNTNSLMQDPNIGNDWITQKLDHFDEKNGKTWKQQYFYNLNTAKEGSNVNFLYLSGEQTAYDGMVSSGSYVGYAEMLGAPIYALEHRFYGDSHPTEDTSLSNLQYFSSRQAVEDIAEFIRLKNEEKGGEQKWIVVGGSYAGNLAAWSRLKHPDLIAGSLASSAPLLAQMDFYGYLQTVDQVFAKQGGLCYDQISKGLDEAMRLMQSPKGRDQLSETFKINPPLSDYDPLSPDEIESFYSYLLSPFMESAQYSSPRPAKLCEQFTINGDDYDPLHAFAALISFGMDVNFTASVASLSDVTFEGDYEDRLWIYQTCAEFGYFQSTDTGTNVFGQVFTTRTFIEYCIELFGIDVDQIQRNVESTNEYYGERDYFAGTNVFFSHGSQDPWSYLTKSSDPKHWSVVIAEIKDGSHCEDLGLPCLTPNDMCAANMAQVQTLTLENMKRWIDPVFPVPDRVEITDNVGQRPQLYNDNVKPALPVNANAPEAVIRARRTEINRTRTHKRSRWNKFTGKRRDVVPSRTISDLASRKYSCNVQLDDEKVGNDWIEQTFDHFNPNEERTFKQQWFLNLKYGTVDGPNFLLIGGEGLEDIYWVQDEKLPWMTYAKEVGANAFLLEHRYYGKSKLGTNDLQYLTSAQMLYDVATFIRTQQVKHGRTGPWITFGGSYPGLLSAWSREWFPELIVGAVASSAPVQQMVDNYMYLEVVEDVLKRRSQKCYDRTAEAFEQLRELSMSPEGRKKIQEKFKLWPEWTGDENETINPLDLNEVFSELYAVFQDAVQYNPVNWKTVQSLCFPMEGDFYDEPIDRLRAAQERMSDDGPDVETLSSFEEEIRPLINARNFIEVLYMWQTCNELGVYQTTDYGNGIFGTPVPINFFITMCERIFGVGMNHVTNGVARTIYQYGGRQRYNATNVVFTNGDADPWHVLGLLERGDRDESVVPIVIKGTSHCTDMQEATLNDPQELTKAREETLENIKKWLGLDRTTENPAGQSSEITEAPESEATESIATTDDQTSMTPTTSTKTTSSTTHTSTAATPTTSSIGRNSLISATICVIFCLIL